MIRIAAAAAAAILVLSVILYISTNHGTIKITLSDPKASVEVKIDGEAITVSALDEPIQFRPGKHHLEVTGKGYKHEE